MEEPAIYRAAIRRDGPHRRIIDGAEAVQIARDLMKGQTLARNKGAAAGEPEPGEYVVLEVFHAGDTAHVGVESFRSRVGYKLSEGREPASFECPLDGSCWNDAGTLWCSVAALSGPVANGQDTLVSDHGTAWLMQVEWRAGQPDGQGTLF